MAGFGIPNVPGDLATNADEAVEIAKICGYHGCPQKIVAEGLLHKSDAGGIKLNIKSDDEAARSF